MTAFAKNYLSFDIGITNLAMCRLSYSTPLNTPPNGFAAVCLHELQLINLVTLSPPEDTPVTHMDDGFDFEPLPDDNTEIKTPVTLIRPVAVNNDKSKNVTVADKPVISSKPTVSGLTMNIHEVCERLLGWLMYQSDHHWFAPDALSTPITDILVEQQPISLGKFAKGDGSVRMKIIEHTILTFFMTYTQLKGYTHIRINSVSPANKLKCVVDPTNFLAPLLKSSKSSSASTYKERKQKTVDLFHVLLPLIQTTDVIREQWASSKKRNDMSDCVFQAYHDLHLALSQQLKQTARAEKTLKVTKKRKRDVEKK